MLARAVGGRCWTPSEYVPLSVKMYKHGYSVAERIDAINGEIMRKSGVA